MTKIPVTKTVVRNGQTHVQTYWEEDEKKSSKQSALVGLGVSLPPQQQKASFPQDVELESQWRVIMGDQFDSSDDAQAAIAAGLTFAAAQSLIKTLPEGTSLSDHVYENGMDQQPRPRGGWKNTDGHPSSDQRRAWEMKDIPLEAAVEWINAGFERPWTGVAELIQKGVPAERAGRWSNDMAFHRGVTGGAEIRLAWHELTSSLTLEEARKWRVEFSGKGEAYMTAREVEFHDKGFTAAVAKRWDGICYEDVDVDQMLALKHLKWSPTSVHKVLKFMDAFNSKLIPETTQRLIEITPQVGSPKRVMEWAETEWMNRDGDTPFTDDFISRLHAVEQFKEYAVDEYGIGFAPESNRYLLYLLPRHRETLLELMDTKSGFLASTGKDISEYTTLARFISSPENLAVLKNHGFVFADPQTDLPYGASFGTDKYDEFDAASADEHSRKKWMKELAFAMYSTSRRNPREISRWSEDDSIDPVQLKDVLLNAPDINDVRIEALLIANVAQPVAEGWL